MDERLIAAFFIEDTSEALGLPDSMSCRCVNSGLCKQLHAAVVLLCALSWGRECEPLYFAMQEHLQVGPHFMYCDVFHACSSGGTAAPAQRPSCQSSNGTCLPGPGPCDCQRLYIACCFAVEVLCAAQIGLDPSVITWLHACLQGMLEPQLQHLLKVLRKKHIWALNVSVSLPPAPPQCVTHPSLPCPPLHPNCPAFKCCTFCTRSSLHLGLAGDGLLTCCASLCFGQLEGRCQVNRSAL